MPIHSARPECPLQRLDHGFGRIPYTGGTAAHPTQEVFDMYIPTSIVLTFNPTNLKRSKRKVK